MPLFVGSDLTCLRGHRLVFSGLGFGLDPGGALILRGPNGSGKSSLLRVMAGLLKPYVGGLLWDGEIIADEPDRHRARVSYIGHLDAVKPVLTAQENLEFWAALAGDEQPAVRAQVGLERMGVIQLADVPGRFLSAGQKRRLSLARIVTAPQPLWLMDEPMNSLDRSAVGMLENAIADHRARGGMIVVSTHTELAIPGASILPVDQYSPSFRGG